MPPVQIPHQYEVIISPMALDFCDSSSGLWGGVVLEAPPTSSMMTSGADHVSDSLDRILALKRERQGTDSALDLHTLDTASLRQDRADAWKVTTELAHRLPACIGSVAVYGFADIASLGSRDPRFLYGRTLGETPHLVRVEEVLEPQANAIVESVVTALKHEKSARYVLTASGVERTNADGSTSAIKLQGYTYNRSGNGPGERQHFPDFPSCEAFLAASALEQTALGGQVLRIIPASMKSREKWGRDLLRITGVTDLPILSLAVGSDGTVRSIIPWGPYNQTAELRQAVQDSSQSTAVMV